jgi:hypothetical protein
VSTPLTAKIIRLKVVIVEKLVTRNAKGKSMKKPTKVKVTLTLKTSA